MDTSQNTTKNSSAIIASGNDHISAQSQGPALDLELGLKQSHPASQGLPQPLAVSSNLPTTQLLPPAGNGTLVTDVTAATSGTNLAPTIANNTLQIQASSDPNHLAGGLIADPNGLLLPQTTPNLNGHLQAFNDQSQINPQALPQSFDPSATYYNADYQSSAYYQQLDPSWAGLGNNGVVQGLPNALPSIAEATGQPVNYDPGSYDLAAQYPLASMANLFSG